ncbi:precorrin-2 dehydrogenase/sirohydrochlorin ferrochelatase family protein [Eubacterium aggregans]|uniref:precorrin-2 dehydrogenase/sirohydrochlorin ferrochelatase family protein n=1 Tax=Eubacterium aggregans TaxID=81409 RepID=UPI003F2A8A13
MAGRLPLLFTTKERKALVVGGGRVGCRRARTLAESGCILTLVTADLPVEAVAGTTLCLAKYGQEHLEGMALVVAATDDARVNAKIVADCKARGILVNCVENPEVSDFIFPSVVRRGDLTLSVCTEGASPTLIKAIVSELRVRYDESYGPRLTYLKKLRQRTLALSLNTDEKQARLKDQAAKSVEELQKEWEKEQ